MACNVVLLGIAQQGDPSEDPVVRVLGRLQQQREDVVEIRTARLLVDGAFIQVAAVSPLLVDGVHVDGWYGRVEDLGRRLKEAGIAAVPAGAVQEQPVDVHPCGINGWMVNSNPNSNIEVHITVNINNKAFPLGITTHSLYKK